VRKVHLLYPRKLLNEIGQPFGAFVIDVVLIKLQHSQLPTAMTKLEDLRDASRC
jgi:hypothetical protein